MESNAFKCWVVLHQLPASAVGRGWCAIPSLAQAGADVGKVTLKVSDAVAHSSVLKLPTEQIKEELMEVIYIKEEPFGAGAHSSVLNLPTEQIKEELMEVIDIKEETFDYDDEACASAPTNPGCSGQQDISPSSRKALRKASTPINPGCSGQQDISPSSRKALRKARCELTQVVTMIDKALRDDQSYQNVKNLIMEDKAAIPRNLRQYLKQHFNVMNRSSMETPKATNEWLKKHVIYHENQGIVPFPVLESYDCDEIFSYLVRSKNTINLQRKSLMADHIHFGYFLELFCEKHHNEYVSGTKKSTARTVLKEQLGFSISHSNRLRWIGKLGYHYQKLMNLSLSLNALFRKQRQITKLFKHHPILANEWKIESH